MVQAREEEADRARTSDLSLPLLLRSQNASLLRFILVFGLFRIGFRATLLQMSIDQIAPEALKLPARERALLAASLWESIEDPFELAVDLDDEAAISLAEKRDREVEGGTVAAVAHEELMRRLRR